MESNNITLLTEVADYYSSKLAEHGETPRGVDWNGEESQILRFEQLTKLLPSTVNFSLNDLGCGYGALFDYLKSHYLNFTYYGSDISEDMVRAARERYVNDSNVLFETTSEPSKTADYSIASGIFNVRLGHSDVEWRAYVEANLDVLDRISQRGFAFNCLTSYSDQDKMREYLYYADPCFLFDLFKRKYSRHVALLHDYWLYEFTTLVRKQS